MPPAKLGYGFFCPTCPVAASSQHPCSSCTSADGAGEALVGGNGCHHGLVLPTRDRLAVPGGKVWLNPRRAVGEQITVHACRCPSLHRCCFAALQHGRRRERSRSDRAHVRYCPLFTRSHLDA